MGKKPTSIGIWYNLPSGGSKRQVFYHAKGLLERGYSIEAYRPPVPQSAYLDLSQLVKETEIPLTYPEIPNTRLLKKIRAIYQNPMDRQAAMEEHCKRVAEQIKKHDVLFANTCRHFAASPLSRYSTIPSLLYLGEPCRPLYEAQPRLATSLPQLEKNRNLKRKLGDFVVDYCQNHEVRYRITEERKSVDAYDEILVNSVYSREACLKTYARDTRVCYLGVDTTVFYPLNLERQPFFLGLGSFDRIKNPMLAVEAIGASKHRDYPLVWVCNFANPDYLVDVRKRSEQLGVRLEVKEMVTDQELLTLLNTATALLYTSRLEPFGLAALEASACGLPVLGAQEAGIRETVMDGVNGLLALDSESFAENINRICAERNLSNDLSQGGLKWVQSNWTLEHCTDRIEAEIVRLLAK